MLKNRKKVVWVILLSIIVILAGIIIMAFLIDSNRSTQNKFSCDMNLDCVSQCSRGCVNSDWAALNPDATECFRAWDCSCVKKECYTDGNPPKN